MRRYEPLDKSWERSAPLDRARVQVLPALIKQHAKNTETLRAGGYTSVARVPLRTLREAMGIEEGAFYTVIDELEAAGLILREHGLARPIGVT